MINILALPLQFNAPRASRSFREAIKEIKKLLIDKDLTVTAIAEAIEEDRTAVSRVLTYERSTARIRKKLQRKYRIRFVDGHGERAA